jgi:hypothetical protein
MIPSWAATMRAAVYRTGGSQRGNRPWRLTQLTTIPMWRAYHTMQLPAAANGRAWTRCWRSPRRCATASKAARRKLRPGP